MSIVAICNNRRQEPCKWYSFQQALFPFFCKKTRKRPDSSSSLVENFFLANQTKQKSMCAQFTHRILRSECFLQGAGSLLVHFGTIRPRSPLGQLRGRYCIEGWYSVLPGSLKVLSIHSPHRGVAKYHA